MAADDPRGSNAPTTGELRRDVSALREIMETRLDGMDRATALLAETVNRTPTSIQIAVGNLREVTEEKLTSQHRQYEEKFRSIQQQFSERDIRTQQAAAASASALSAALQAAKEAVYEQAQSAAKAAEKTELSFTKQIDQIQLQIKTIGDGFSDRIAELKERTDRGEGQNTGQDRSLGSPYEIAAARQLDRIAQQAAQRAVIAQVIAAIAVLASVISVIVLIVRKLAGPATAKA